MVAVLGALRRAVLGARARRHRRCEPAVGRRRPGARRPRCCWRSCRGCRPPDAANGLGLSSGSVRITSGTNRRLRLFAVTQIAASFVLLAGAGMLLTTLFALQRRTTGFDTRNVLALNVPVMSLRRKPDRRSRLLQGSAAAHRRVARRRARRGRHVVPWRDEGVFGPGFQFSVEGYAQGQRRRGSARAVPHRLARLLRVARRADHRRPRLHRRRSRATPRRS